MKKVVILLGLSLILMTYINCEPTTSITELEQNEQSIDKEEVESPDDRETSS